MDRFVCIHHSQQRLQDDLAVDLDFNLSLKNFPVIKLCLKAILRFFDSSSV
jgi:hypothetical protein